MRIMGIRTGTIERTKNKEQKFNLPRSFLIFKKRGFEDTISLATHDSDSLRSLWRRSWRLRFDEALDVERVYANTGICSSRQEVLSKGQISDCGIPLFLQKNKSNLCSFERSCQRSCKMNSLSLIRNNSFHVHPTCPPILDRWLK